MSAYGMGIAGSVAQGAVQAGQLSRAQHRQGTDQSADARKVRAKLSEHFEAVEEGDEANLVSQLHVDEEVPQHERQAQPFKGEERENACKDEAAMSPDVPGTGAPTAPPQTPSKDLYRHVDVQA